MKTIAIQTHTTRYVYKSKWADEIQLFCTFYHEYEWLNGQRPLIKCITSFGCQIWSSSNGLIFSRNPIRIGQLFASAVAIHT